MDAVRGAGWRRLLRRWPVNHTEHMSAEQNAVLILTINDCPGMRVVRVIGPVYGTGVRSRNIVGNFLGGVRAIFGGKQVGYMSAVNPIQNLRHLAKPRTFIHEIRIWPHLPKSAPKFRPNEVGNLREWGGITGWANG